MDQHSLSENPYSSPNARPTAATAGQITGAVWEDNRVTVVFERTLEDHVIAEWFRMQHYRSRGREILRLAIIAALTMLTLWLLFLITGRPNGTVAVVAVVYFAFLVWALSMRRRLRLVRRILNRWVTTDAHEHLASVRVTFDQEGFDSSTQWERRVRRWSAVGSLIELGDHYLLVHGGIVTLVIPKRAFADAEESERFLGWIHQHVQVKA